MEFIIHRRENCTLNFTTMKASAIEIYQGCREWSVDDTLSPRIRECLELLLVRCARYLGHKGSLSDCYQSFEELHKILEEIRKLMVPAGYHNIWSRLHQYERFMLFDFDKLRIVTDLRTPSGFRSGYFFVFMKY